MVHLSFINEQIDRRSPEKGEPSAKRCRTADATITSKIPSNPGDGGTMSDAVKDEQNMEESGASSKGPVSMTLVADTNLLDCPICFEPLSSPVYQCENGHIACGSCSTTVLKNKCANCQLPVEKIRCRAIEKVVESVRVRCQYTPHGCKQMFSYSYKVAHEKTCNCVPCSCPTGCGFFGNSKRLYKHFSSKHKDSSKQCNYSSWISISMETTEKHVILQEGKAGALFVVNRCIESVGSYFNVVCVAPPASKDMWYKLKADIGEDWIKLRSSVEMVSKWTAQLPAAKMSLLVPNNFISKTQPLTLHLIISQRPFADSLTSHRSGIRRKAHFSDSD